MSNSFELLELIGAGGMATVHRARLRHGGRLDRAIALKRIHTSLANRADIVAGFVREAQIAAALGHPNIVQIYEAGCDEVGHFIAMELVEGRSLIEIVRAANAAGLEVPPSVALCLLHQLCDALDHAHTRHDAIGPLELVHRDITPGNLLVAWSGHLKLIDFGIATTARWPAPDVRDPFVGKLSYMAPEALRGDHLDARADVFAVGVVAWEMLTGRPLFTGASEAETFERVAQAPVVPPSTYARECPLALDTWVLAALAKDRDLRPPSAAAMRDELDHVIAHGRFRATPPVVARWLQAPELHAELTRPNELAEVAPPPPSALPPFEMSDLETTVEASAYLEPVSAETLRAAVEMSSTTVRHVRIPLAARAPAVVAASIAAPVARDVAAIGGRSLVRELGAVPARAKPRTPVSTTPVPRLAPSSPVEPLPPRRAPRASSCPLPKETPSSVLAPLVGRQTERSVACPPPPPPPPSSSKIASSKSPVAPLPRPSRATTPATGTPPPLPGSVVTVDARPPETSPVALATARPSIPTIPSWWRRMLVPPFTSSRSRIVLAAVAVIAAVAVLLVVVPSSGSVGRTAPPSIRTHVMATPSMPAVRGSAARSEPESSPAATPMALTDSPRRAKTVARDHRTHDAPAREHESSRRDAARDEATRDDRVPAIETPWPVVRRALPPLPAAHSPAPEKPVTIAPGRVHRVSGQISPLDVHRLENEGLLDTTLHALLCIDEAGAVTSVRFVGEAPRWLRARVATDLRTFRFSPYIDRTGAHAACFVRSLPIVAR